MKKRAVIISLLAIILVFAAGTQIYAGVSKYQMVKDDLKTAKLNLNQDGSEGKKAPIYYKKNNDIDKAKLKQPNEIKGFVPDATLAEKGGKYTLKKLMTYEEYYNLGIDDTIRHDIEPDRLVWVFTSRFNKTHYVNGYPVEKAVVTTLYDAETGDMLSFVATSEDPHGLDKVKKD